MSTATNPLVIDAEADFLEIEIHGHKLKIDAFDALDELVKIDAAHKGDPDGDDSYLDDVAKLICERSGAPHCSRRGASQFYSLVVDRVNAAKKKNTSTPQSPTGSTDETATIGQSRVKGRGSQSSRGSKRKRS